MHEAPWDLLGSRRLPRPPPIGSAFHCSPKETPFWVLTSVSHRSVQLPFVGPPTWGGSESCPSTCRHPSKAFHDPGVPLPSLSPTLGLSSTLRLSRHTRRLGTWLPSRSPSPPKRCPDSPASFWSCYSLGSSVIRGRAHRVARRMRQPSCVHVIGYRSGGRRDYWRPPSW